MIFYIKSVPLVNPNWYKMQPTNSRTWRTHLCVLVQPCIQKTEAKGSQDRRQPGLQGKTLSRKKQNRTKEGKTIKASQGPPDAHLDGHQRVLTCSASQGKLACGSQGGRLSAHNPNAGGLWDAGCLWTGLVTWDEQDRYLCSLPFWMFIPANVISRGLSWQLTKSSSYLPWPRVTSKGHLDK